MKFPYFPLSTMSWIAVAAFIPILYLIALNLRQRLINAQRRRLGINANDQSIAFFHPFCHQGGGGERVLWTAIQAIQTKLPAKRIVIYTTPASTCIDSLLETVKRQFNLDLKSTHIHLITVYSWMLLEPQCYPRFTLLLQSLGSVVVVLEALVNFIPDLYIDTLGHSFTLPVAKIIGGSRVAAYVHYPTISPNMLEKVASHKADFNNTSTIANSPTLSMLKLWYYRGFALAYRIAGAFANVVMVNSTWTYTHINGIWKRPAQHIHIIYPPCDTRTMVKFPLTAEHRKRVILSVAQFRPEKAHSLQIQAFALCKSSDCHLILVGSSRNENDAARAKALREESVRLGVQERVTVVENADYSLLLEYLESSLIGIHTMVDEHFGINVIEFMASGLICIANDSGGPKTDIVVDYKGQPTGFRATTAQEYADRIDAILSDPNSRQIVAMRQAARDHVLANFSADAFATSFLDCIGELL